MVGTHLRGGFAGGTLLSNRGLRALGRVWRFLLLTLGGVLFLAPGLCLGQTAQLLVQSNVEGATVTVDGADVGATNVDGEALIDRLPSGAHTVELRKMGYWTASTRVTLEPGLTNSVSLELTARDLGGAGLLIRTNVVGALVLWNGEQRAQTGSDGQAYLDNLKAGEHRLTVRREGYESASRTVTIPDTNLDQDIRLRLPRAPSPPPVAVQDEPEPADTTAPSPPPTTRLLISTNVGGADVYVDSSYRGRTRRTGNLALTADPGEYDVTVKKEGFSPVEKTVHLVAGTKNTTSVTLQEAPYSIVSFFTGGTLTVVLAGILAALVGALSVVVILYARSDSSESATDHSNAFDRYRLVNAFKTEGITALHLAKDPVEGRQVMLRLLNEEYSSNPEVVQAFLEQGQALKGIAESQPDAPIVKAYRYGREKDWDQGRPFIALEYVQGDRLSSYLHGRTALPVREALAIIQQVCKGLQAAHGHQLWHRNLTPDNVVVTRTRPQVRVKLVNFLVGEPNPVPTGAQENRPLRNPSYMAPEQCRGEAAHGSADVYSAGILFYMLVTGTTPFRDENPTKIMEMHETAPRPRLPEEIPSYVEPLFRRMLSKDPEHRPDASNIVAIIDLVQATT